MTRYTVLSGMGEHIESGLTAAEAGRALLQHDGADYEVRRRDDGGYQLFWRRNNAPWSSTFEFSFADDADAAETEILEGVADKREWNGRGPTIVTDERYMASLAEAEEDAA